MFRIQPTPAGLWVTKPFKLPEYICLRVKNQSLNAAKEPG